MKACASALIAGDLASTRPVAPAATPFLPKRLAPQLALIRGLDDPKRNRPSGLVSKAQFMHALLPLILGAGETAMDFYRAVPPGTSDVLSRLVDKRSLRIEDVIDLHASIVPEAEAGMRRGSVRCGGIDDESAFYLPPPASVVEGYAKDIVLFIREMERHRERWFVAAVVAAVQLILVHPFVEGNGRIARALFSIVACRNCGYSLEIIEEIRRLWANESMLIESVGDRVIANRGWNRNTLVVLRNLRDEQESPR